MKRRAVIGCQGVRHTLRSAARRAVVEQRLSRRRCTAALVLFLAAPRCDDEPAPPPDDAPPPATQPAIDTIHSARISADRNFTVPNIVLACQPDPAGGRSLAVSLATARPAPDGTRLVFGTVESSYSVADLLSKEIHFGGAALLDVTGNGIFTPLGVYQPKLAVMNITGIEKNEVNGVLTGEFYVFRGDRPLLRPRVIRVEATFSALLVEP